MDAVLMRDDATLATSPPSEVKVKNIHVQEVEEWIARSVKETIFGYIKSNALEKVVERAINWKNDKLELGDESGRTMPGFRTERCGYGY
jgi:hypothetical protein